MWKVTVCWKATKAVSEFVCQTILWLKPMTSLTAKWFLTVCGPINNVFCNLTLSYIGTDYANIIWYVFRGAGRGVFFLPLYRSRITVPMFSVIVRYISQLLTYLAKLCRQRKLHIWFRATAAPETFHNVGNFTTCYNKVDLFTDPNQEDIV